MIVLQTRQSAVNEGSARCFHLRPYINVADCIIGKCYYSNKLGCISGNYVSANLIVNPIKSDVIHLPTFLYLYKHTRHNRKDRSKTKKVTKQTLSLCKV